MARAKTIKKAGAVTEEVVASSNKKKVRPSTGEAREYAVTESFAKGDVVYHKVWDDTGEVIETGTTEDGINKMKVAFEKVGVKNLRMG